MTALKIAFLFLAVWFTLVNAGRVYYKNSMPAMNTFWQSVGIVGFVVLQFKLY